MQISMSIWMPVSRANFYSTTETNSLKDVPKKVEWNGDGPPPDLRWCWSTRTENTTYVPLMLVNVLRRLLEVMPEVVRLRLQGALPVPR